MAKLVTALFVYSERISDKKTNKRLYPLGSYIRYIALFTYGSKLVKLTRRYKYYIAYLYIGRKALLAKPRKPLAALSANYI